MKNLSDKTKERWLYPLLLFLLCSVGFTTQLNAQNGFTVKGTVVDETNFPLPGATVMEKGGSNGVVTDLDGNFSLTVSKKGATLTISFIGFTTKEVAAKSSPLKVTLSENSKLLDEVVVVGYGTMKKRDVTGAITSISSEAIEKKMATNVFEVLQGTTAGVQVISGSGQPGESSSIKIRGTSTFSAEGVTPLYIVDGVPLENIDAINTNDIVSMEVLKDAASAAIYGSRSANGVIIITTKSGQEGKPRIDLKYNHSWGTLSHKIAQANRSERLLYDQYRKEYFETYDIAGANPNESIEILDDPLNCFFNTDNDYLDMIANTAQKDQVDISVGGGTKTLKYFINTGYYNEKGIINNTGFQRLSTRINADYTATKWLTMGSRISLTYSQKKGLDEGQLLNSVLTRRPYFNTYYPDGSLVGVFNGQKNPIAQINYTTDFTDSYRANFFQYFEVKLNKYLKFRANINANFYLDKRKKMEPSIITDEWQRKNKGYAYNYLNWNWMNEDFITYSRKIKGHNINIMAGFSAQQWRSENETFVGINSSTDFIYTMNAFAANLDLSATGSTLTNHAIASIFARATYDYKGKYLFTANIRRDGSSRFAKENKWGNFPSVSAGWRFSDEKFMKFAKNILNDGKIRASYGITGNEAIGNYDYIYSYSPHSIYDGVGGVTPTRIGKGNLKWEETKQFNLGLDLNLWNSRLIITADYYDKYTDGLLANYQLPKESGFASMKTNVGEMSNRGYEIAVTGDIIRTKDWKWNASFNISKNINRIEKLSEGKAYMEGDIWWMQEGGRVGDFYGFKSAGVFAYDESNAFTNKWEQLTPVFEDGVFQYKYLLNGKEYTGEVSQKKLPNGKAFRGGDYNWEEPEGTRDGVIDDNDRMVIGNAMPDVTGGLNTTVSWKNLSLYLGFYYSLGGQIYNSAEHNRNMFKYTGTTPSPEVIHNIWLHPGDQAIYPRPYNDDYNNARMGNSFYLEDASFIRLQNVRIAYDLPESWIKKLMLKNINVYAFVNNALTWTNYSGFDPEFSTRNPLQIGKDTYRYPRKREYGIGFSANF
ncbi:TonB-dependent receptor [uncultured Bacteroides sp.]|uniref:SusC/RagA family TonB-linked outer membrane protein n=1 Tax=uncultured Bacteroides sp. TaxID=162156 RepID=UPI0025D96F8F|nr:TonB-dependent receptor [uncultured Bacteroides sp.]